MKRLSNPSLLISCFAPALFAFPAFVSPGDNRNAEKTPWDNWYEKALLPASDFREQLANDHGFSITAPPAFSRSISSFRGFSCFSYGGMDRADKNDAPFFFFPPQRNPMAYREKTGI